MERKLARYRLLLVVVILGLAARLATIFLHGPSVIHFADGPDYRAAASILCASGVYPEHSSLPFFRAPGLPLFIAAVTGCHPRSTWLVKTGLALVDTASIAVLYGLGLKLFRNHRVGLITAAAAAINPFFIAQIDIQTEALFQFFLITATWLVLTGRRRPSSFMMLLAGLCAAGAALTRPVGLLLIPLLGAIPFLARRPAWGTKLRLAAAVAAGAVLGLSPWAVRDELRYHELILVNDAGGYNFWRGTNPQMMALDSVRDPQVFAKAAWEFEHVTSPEAARRIEARGCTPLARSRLWFQLGALNLSRDPRQSVRHLLHNAWVYWRPWLNPQARPRSEVIASGLLLIPLYAFAVAGWLALFRRKRSLAIWCAAGALLFCAAHLPFQVVSRFRVPIADPFLLAFASAPSVKLRKQLASRKRKPAAAAPIPLGLTPSCRRFAPLQLP